MRAHATPPWLPASGSRAESQPAPTDQCGRADQRLPWPEAARHDRANPPRMGEPRAAASSSAWAASKSGSPNRATTDPAMTRRAQVEEVGHRRRRARPTMIAGALDDRARCARRSGRFISRSMVGCRSTNASRQPRAPHAARRPSGSTMTWPSAGVALRAVQQPAASTISRSTDAGRPTRSKKLATSDGVADATLRPAASALASLSTTTGSLSDPRRSSRAAGTPPRRDVQRRDRSGAGSIGPPHRTPHRRRSALDLVRGRGEHAAHELLEDPPHLAARRADPVANQRLTRSVDDARSEPIRIDDHRRTVDRGS